MLYPLITTLTYCFNDTLINGLFVILVYKIKSGLFLYSLNFFGMNLIPQLIFS